MCVCRRRHPLHHVTLCTQAQLKQLSKTGRSLSMPAAAAAVPVPGGSVLPSIDIAKVLAKKTIDATITGA